MSKLSVFISYSRSDMGFVDRLQESLRARGIEAEVDREAIEKGEAWWARIEQLITEVDTVVFVLSANSAGSPVCQDEVDFAESRNKRIIPIVVGDLGTTQPPEALQRLNHIYFFENSRAGASGDYDEALDQLVTALQTDIGWIREHSRIGALAERWRLRERPGELLLRGAELSAAETWLTSRPAKAPEPTDAQLALITDSRQAAVRGQRRTIVLALAALVVAVGLAGYAFWQQQIAIENESLAGAERDRAIAALETQSRMVADRSQQVSKAGMQLESVLLAAEVLPDTRAKDSLRRNWPRTNEAHFRLLAAMTGAYGRAAFPEPAVAGSNAYFSPDSRYLIATTYSSGAVIWDLETGRAAKRLWGHASNVTDAVFSPDGTLAATASYDETVRIWDVASGKTKYVLRANPDSQPRNLSAARVLIAHDNRFAIARSNGLVDGKYQIARWPLKHNAPPRMLHAQADAITNFALSPDSRVLAIATLAGLVSLIATADGTLLAEFDGHKTSVSGYVGSVDFDQSTPPESGYRLLTAGHDKTVRILRFKPVQAAAGSRGRLSLTAPVEGLRITLGVNPSSARFGHLGKRVVLTTSTGFAVQLWDAATGQQVSQLLQFDGGVGNVRLSPDGRSYVTPGLRFGPAVWWVDGKSDYKILNTGIAPNGRFSKDGSRIATPIGNGKVLVYSGPDFERRATLSCPAKQIASLAFLEDDRELVGVSRDSKLCLWETITGKLLKTTKLPGNPSLGFASNIGMIANANGSLLLIKSYFSQFFTVWDVRN